MIIPFSFWGGGSIVYPPTPNHCWSLYKRNPLYTGAAIRIATSAAGNAQTDIGFSGGKIDTAAILSHVGSNTAWVVKAYHQFGGPDLNYIFGLLGYAPRIAVGGSIITFSNGEPAIEFGAGTDQGASALTVGGTDLFSSASTIFYSYQASFTGSHIFGGSGSVTSPYHAYSFQGESWYPSSGFGDPNPMIFHVNEATPINSAAPTAGQVYTALTGTPKIVAEPGIDLVTGTGYTWGMRWENANSYFRGKSSEILIYNSVKNQADSYDIQSKLNKALKFY